MQARSQSGRRDVRRGQVRSAVEENNKAITK